MMMHYQILPAITVVYSLTTDSTSTEVM